MTSLEHVFSTKFLTNKTARIALTLESAFVLVINNEGQKPLWYSLPHGLFASGDLKDLPDKPEDRDFPYQWYEVTEKEALALLERKSPNRFGGT